LQETTKTQNWNEIIILAMLTICELQIYCHEDSYRRDVALFLYVLW